MKAAGAVAISDDGLPVMSRARDAARHGVPRGPTICPDPALRRFNLSAGGDMLRARNRCAGDCAAFRRLRGRHGARDLLLAELTVRRYHVAHVFDAANAVAIGGPRRGAMGWR